MRIGLTFDLRTEYLALGWSAEDAAEFDTEATIQSIESGLRELGHEVVRIGRCPALAGRLAEGERWELVFNFCEGARGRSREAQVPALLECFDIPYTFCDPLTAALTLDKALAKRVVRDAGLPTPDFLLVEEIEDLRSLSMPFPLFAKPVAEGTGKGIDADSICRDRAALEATCRRLIERFRQPALVEEFLPGREVTVGLVGTGRDARALGVMEVRLLQSAEKGVYSYQNKEQCEQRVEYRLVEPGPFRDEAARVALECYRLLGCRDAARLDLRADAQGRPNFIEANPLAGMNPSHSDLPILNGLLGNTYQDLLSEILRSAMKRAGTRPGGPLR
ncbi:MAG: D-alanine--D-alanine ligase [Candidatus Brocadiia bacterium]|jgi:D-alanine-D-alanine ligase